MTSLCISHAKQCSYCVHQLVEMKWLLDNRTLRCLEFGPPVFQNLVGRGAHDQGNGFGIRVEHQEVDQFPTHTGSIDINVKDDQPGETLFDRVECDVARLQEYSVEPFLCTAPSN